MITQEVFEPFLVNFGTVVILARHLSDVPENAPIEIQSRIRELQEGIKIQRMLTKALQDYSLNFKDKIIIQQVKELECLWKLVTTD